MEFEWDTAKSDATYHARGFDFAYASRIFTAEWIEIEDIRIDYGETRVKAVGEVEGIVLTVVYTIRGYALRIISARRANSKERALWHLRA